MKNHFFKLTAILSFFVLTGCVAPLEPPKSNTDYKNIIGKPFKLGNIEVAQYDFPEKMNWEDALKSCDSLGNGWKLPNKDELDYLYTNRVPIGGFADYAYWTSEENYTYYAWAQYFSGGNQVQGSKINARFYVRAIRAL